MLNIFLSKFDIDARDVIKNIKNFYKKVLKNGYKPDYLCYNLVRGEYG